MIARIRASLRELSEDTESGQTMVEFALVFPVQLWLTVLIVQFAFIGHAYLVVGQAAFLGARAAAVADVNNPTSPLTERRKAARRTAARTVALLTSGGTKILPATPAASDGALDWQAAGPTGRHGFPQGRQDEAYALLKTQVFEGDGFVSCEVRYDYVLLMPAVMPGLFTTVIQGRETWRIERIAFVPTPWTKAPM